MTQLDPTSPLSTSQAGILVFQPYQAGSQQYWLWEAAPPGEVELHSLEEDVCQRGASLLVLEKLRRPAGHAAGRVADVIEQVLECLPGDQPAGLRVITTDLSHFGFSLEELLQFEAEIGPVLEQRQAAALWQLSIEAIGAWEMLALVATHPMLRIGGGRFRNPIHIPPHAVLESGSPTALVFHWLQSIALRQELERGLADQSDWFRAIFDNIFQFVGVCLPDGTLIEANRAALEFGGFDRSAVIGRPFWEAPWWSLRPEIGAQLREAIRQAAAGQFVRYEVEVLGHGPDGDYTRTIDFSLQPVLDDQGKVLLLIPEGRDITEKQAAERALVEREQFLKTVLDNVPIALFLIQADGTIVVSTGRGRRGLQRTNTVGKSLFEVYQDRPDIVSYYQRALQGETVRVEVNLEGRIFDTLYSPFYDEQNQITGVLGVATDITDRVAAEHAMHASQARFRTIFDISAIGIALQDLDGRVLETNEAFRSMLGYSDEELRSKRFSDFTHPGDLETNWALYNLLVTGQEEHFRVEKRYIRKDGEVIWGRLTTSLVRDERDRPQAIVAMVEDITQQKRMEAELLEVQRRLMASREGERLHMAQELHDGPLQEMYGLAFKLKELMADLDDAHQDKLQQMEDSLQGQIRTVRQMCGDLRPPALAPFGLEKAIRSHADTFQQAHPELKLRLDLDHDRQQLPEPMRLALFRVYQELLNNIIRHAQASEVWIRFQVNEQEITLQVRDNGRGFDMPRKWLKMAREGHLGLLGAQERAESIGGHLEVQSQPGAGTTVTVTVPRTPPADTDLSIASVYRRSINF